jgi:polyphosphate kinase
LPHRSRCLSARSTALTAAKIRICAAADCRPRELRALMKQVERDVLPLLTPIAVGPSAPFPHMPSLSLNVGVVGDEHDSLFICISIPQDVPRFLEVVSRGVRVPVETAVGQSFAFPLLATTLVGQRRAAEDAGPIAEY